MKFSLIRPVKVVMLGAGGTGGHIAPHLYRLLYALDRPVRFIICDGDVVEEKNLVRQNFVACDLGRNKAAVLAERYSAAFGMECSYVPDYIESAEELQKLLCPAQKDALVILIGAVDNNRSRQLCNEVIPATVWQMVRLSAASAKAAARCANLLRGFTRISSIQQTSSLRSCPVQRLPSPRRRP